MSTSSHVVVDSVRARDLATAKLEKIRDRRATEIRVWGEQRANEVNAGLLHRLFRRKRVTPEQAIEADRKQGWLYSECLWIEEKFGRTEDLCEQILIAAKMGHPIHLTLEDAERLA